MDEPSSVALVDPVPALSNEWFSATPTGLVVRHMDVPFEVWQEYGRGLARVESAIQWVIGDWLNFGEQRYGETYAQALDVWPETKIESMYDYKYVASRISFRNENLTWTHHKVVAKMETEEQIDWLKAAVEANWTSKQLREQIVAEGKGVDPGLASLIRAALRNASDAVPKAEGDVKAMLVTVVQNLRDCQEMVE